jgi:hypothetical protein
MMIIYVKVVIKTITAMPVFTVWGQNYDDDYDDRGVVDDHKDEDDDENDEDDDE